MSASSSNDEVKNKKECIFSIQKMNKFYLLPFLVPIICFSTKFFSEPIKDDDGKIKLNDINKDVEHTFVFLYQIINSTSLIFGGLLYFVSVLKSKSENKGVQKTDDQTNNNLLSSKINKYNDETIVEDYKKNKLKTILIIIFMSVIITIYNIIKGYATKHPQLEKRLYFLFFFTLINICIFKKPIYSHQKLSLVIGLIGMGIIFSTFFMYLKAEYNYVYDIILFFGSIFYSLYLVSVKYLSTNLGMSPFLLLLLIGSISTLLTIIGYSVFSLINKGNLSYLLNIFHCDKINYVCFGNYWLQIVIYTIINTVLQVIIFLVVYYFSPEVFAISDIISPFFSFLYGFIKDLVKNKDIKIISIVFNITGYLIIIIASFIYNEILVCNFCGFNENTWKAIDKKALDEMNENYSRDSSASDDEKLGKRDSNSSINDEIELSNNVNGN